MKDGSNHELCVLTLTEVIIHAVKHLKIPIVAAFLDKKAAFDSVLKEHVVREVFKAAEHLPTQSILYMARRLESRRTFLQYQHSLMGPIDDDRGVEQGGIKSNRQFQLVSDNELEAANSSGLGIPIGDTNISALGLADDESLVAPTSERLQALIHIVEYVSTYHNLVNVPVKTKILVINPKRSPISDTNKTIVVGGVPVLPSKEALHLGVLRSSSHNSNSPAVLSRMSSHSKSLWGVLSFGSAKNHRASPASALRVELLYCLPKLLSGLAALMLTESEIKAINAHRRKSLRQLQKLLPSTAIPAIYFLSGSLPAEAYLNMRQLCHLFMVASLGNKSSLFQIAIKNCSLPPKESWFAALAVTCTKYGLPSPLQILTNPPPRNPSRDKLSLQ